MQQPDHFFLFIITQILRDGSFHDISKSFKLMLLSIRFVSQRNDLAAGIFRVHDTLCITFFLQYLQNVDHCRVRHGVLCFQVDDTHRILRCNIQVFQKLVLRNREIMALQDGHLHFFRLQSSFLYENGPKLPHCR